MSNPRTPRYAVDNVKVKSGGLDEARKSRLAVIVLILRLAQVSFSVHFGLPTVFDFLLKGRLSFGISHLSFYSFSSP